MTIDILVSTSARLISSSRRMAEQIHTSIRRTSACSWLRAGLVPLQLTSIPCARDSLATQPDHVNAVLAYSAASGEPAWRQTGKRWTGRYAPGSIL